MLKPMQTRLVLLALAATLAPPAGAGAAEFVLDGRTERQSGLPGTEEYEAYRPGIMLQDAQGNGNGTPTQAEVKVIVDDASRSLSFEEIVSKYRKEDYAPIVTQLKALAAGGHSQAQEMLAVMYYNGKGVERDAIRAFDLFRQAAENNSVVAQHHLGVMYFTGDGTGIADPVKALMWLHIAIAHYTEGPEKTRAIQDRDSIYVSGMTRREKERATEMAREWMSNRGEGHLLDLQ